MLARMVAVGESAGSLDEVLDDVARFHENQLQTAIRRLTEPDPCESRPDARRDRPHVLGRRLADSVPKKNSGTIVAVG